MAKAIKLATEGRTSEAIRLYDEITKLGSGKPEWQEAMYRKGLCLYTEKKFSKAIDCWRSVLGQIGSSDLKDDCQLEIARACAFGLNQWDSALKEYSLFFKSHPTSSRLMEAAYQEAGAQLLPPLAGQVNCSCEEKK